jgi:aromatic ring-cleaving dioxygenase
VYLELADVAKRCNEIDNARTYYRKATKLQPLASQGWMEHSKLEEESGNLSKCASILEEGLRHCNGNENLYVESFSWLNYAYYIFLNLLYFQSISLIRAVKFRERVGQLDQARQLLGRLKHLPIEKYWKVMMEGALLEARAGKYMTVAREILKYLTHYGKQE